MFKNKMLATAKNPVASISKRANVRLFRISIISSSVDIVKISAQQFLFL
tara:strand:- start:15832 stop:15978 length:147 start_codon:yes stop_codon:yes gene_type:complete